MCSLKFVGDYTQLLLAGKAGIGSVWALLSGEISDLVHRRYMALLFTPGLPAFALASAACAAGYTAAKGGVGSQGEVTEEA